MFKRMSYLIFITLFSTLLLACGGGGGDSASRAPLLPGITVNPLSITLAENTSTTFEVVLNTEPANDVTINISSSDASEVEVSIAVLNFTNSAGDSPWNIPQTVTVSGFLDGIIDGNQTITLVLNPETSVDSVYRALPQTTVAATISDIDTAGFTVSETSLNTSENGTSGSYTVVLNIPPDGDVVIDVASTDTSEGTVSVASLTFDSINWAVPQTVTIVPVDDTDIDGNQTYNIDMSINPDNTTDASGYAVLTLAPVSVTNIDDDNVSEGSTGTPVVLAYGTDLPFAGMVDNTYSYYELTGLTAGSYYDISISGLLVDADLFVYGDSAYTSRQCRAITETIVDSENCIVMPTGDSLWVKVDGQWTDSQGASYILNAVEVVSDFTGEGTSVAPMILAYGVDLPFSGMVDNTNSYYELTGLTSGSVYNISISGLMANADLFVFDESTYVSTLCSSESTADLDSCSAMPTGDSLWIKVDGQNTIGIGTDYVLNAIEMPTPDFSSANTPLALLDVGTLTDTLSVSEAPVSLSSVEVLVDITHTFDADLIITLISPAGTQIILSYKNGDNGDNYRSTIFSGSASISITSGVAPFIGWFIPEESLSTLNGENGNGTWSLVVEDTASADTGNLLTWGVKLQ